MSPLSELRAFSRALRPAVLLSVLLFCPFAGHPQTKPASPASVIYDRAHGSVVIILVADKDGSISGQGSGFIVGKDRVVTNHHVLKGAAGAVVVFADGKSAPVEGVVADSPAKDVMIVSVDTGARPALRLGDELSVKQGDAVYAIGAPQGLELSITNGIVSGFREIKDQFRLQTTAPIAPGSSGGPLFDSQGRVIGVTTSLLEDSPGIYFSVGAGDISRLLRSPKILITPFASWASENSAAEKSEADARLDQIGKLIDDEKYSEAQEQLAGLLEKTPDDPVLHRLMGEAEFFLGHNQVALAHLETAIEADPKDIMAQGFCALVLFYQSKYSEAAEHQEIAVAGEPSAFNLGFLAEIYYGERQFTKAEEMAAKAVAQDDSNAMAWSVLAGNAFWGRSSQHPVADLNSKVAKNAPDSYWVKIAEAYDSLNSDKTTDGFKQLQEAKKTNFPDPETWLLMAHYYRRTNQIGSARDETATGLVILPDDPQLLAEAVFDSLLLHDEPEASRQYARLVKGSAGSHEQLTSGCLLYYGTGQTIQAFENCEQLAKNYPNDHAARSAFGWALLDADEFQAASDQFDAAYKLVDADKTEAVEMVDLTWGLALSGYYTGDKAYCRKVLATLRKWYPSALTVTGLQQMPLLWSNKTLTRIEKVLHEMKP